MWTTGAGVTCSPSRFKTPGFIHNTPYPHPHPNHLHNQLKHHTTDLSSVVEHLPDVGQGPMYLIPSTNTPQHINTHTQTHINTHTNTHMNTHTNTHKNTHSNTHTHTHIHDHWLWHSHPATWSFQSSPNLFPATPPFYKGEHEIGVKSPSKFPGMDRQKRAELKL